MDWSMHGLLAEQVLKIHNETDELELVGPLLLDGENKYQNGFVSKIDGCLYGIPQPVFDGQEPCDKSEDLFKCATVVRFDKVLGVTFEGQLEPTYVISKAGLAALFETKHWIKHVGEKEPVASTHPWQGSNDMMEVKPGEDVLFMFCLAAIAEDMLDRNAAIKPASTLR